MLFSPALSPSFSRLLHDQRGDEFGEKAVVITLVVLAGIAAWQAFGQAVTGAISSAAGAI